MKRAALAAALLMGACVTASAQTAPVPGTQPAAEIENFPHVDISNGILSARVFPPGKGELNQGSRFDHAGVVFHITYKGQDYSSYWFDRFVTDPMDNGKYPPATEHSCCTWVASSRWSRRCPSNTGMTCPARTPPESPGSVSPLRRTRPTPGG